MPPTAARGSANAPSLGRRFLRAVRTAPDLILHPLRRAVARRRLRGASPRSVLFICHGNVCRSPFAANQFVRACGEWRSGPPETRSAGFIGPNRPSPPEAIAAASRVGIDLNSHKSSVFTAEEIRSTDLIVVMAAEQGRAIRRRFRRPASSVLVLGDLDPKFGGRRTIRDPWGQSADVFDASYERITRCVAELVRVLESRSELPAIVSGLASHG